MERHFDNELEKLKSKLFRMCSLVDEQVTFALRAVAEGDAALSELVIQRDKKVDKFDVKVDKICLKLIALNQPVGIDLRLIMSAITINSNLERMGDLAVDIAKRAQSFIQAPELLVKFQFDEIVRVTVAMVKQAIDAFIGSNANLARKVMLSDDLLDELVAKNTAQLVEEMKADKSNVEAALNMHSILYDLERLGDHATNIAEYVYFIAEGVMIKHKYESFFAKLEADKDDSEDEEDIAQSDG